MQARLKKSSVGWHRGRRAVVAQGEGRMENKRMQVKRARPPVRAAACRNGKDNAARAGTNRTTRKGKKVEKQTKLTSAKKARTKKAKEALWQGTKVLSLGRTQSSQRV